MLRLGVVILLANTCEIVVSCLVVGVRRFLVYGCKVLGALVKFFWGCLLVGRFAGCVVSFGFDCLLRLCGFGIFGLDV